MDVKRLFSCRFSGILPDGQYREDVEEFWRTSAQGQEAEHRASCIIQNMFNEDEAVAIISGSKWNLITG